jgi:hypothetical protein
MPNPSKEFLWAICISLAIALISVLLSPPYQPPYTQQVEPEQQTNQSLEGQQNSNKSKPPVDNGGTHKLQNGDNDGSEYWSILGRKLKITDTLLVL